MPYREFNFEKEQPFHVFSRAVEERKIFSRDEDCYRFIFQIYAANIGKPALNLWRNDIIKVAKAILNGKEVSDRFIVEKHKPLVHILDFALNITHYHFHLVPTVENSIPVFLKKLNGGFAKYFNLKYQRKGTLFSSRYKSIPIKSDFQTDAVSRYISIVNPLDVYQPGWRENGLNGKKRAIEFLKNYQFSSFPDKIGKRKSKILHAQVVFKKKYTDFVGDFLEQRIVLPAGLDGLTLE